MGVGGRPQNMTYGSGVGLGNLTGTSSTNTTTTTSGGVGNVGLSGMPLSPNPSLLNSAGGGGGGGVGIGGGLAQDEAGLDFRTLSPYAAGMDGRPGTAGSAGGGGGGGGVSRNLFVGNVSRLLSFSFSLPCLAFLPMFRFYFYVGRSSLNLNLGLGAHSFPSLRSPVHSLDL